MGLRYSRMSTRAKPKCFCFHRPVNSVLPMSPLAPGGSAMRKYWVAFGWLSLCVCVELYLCVWLWDRDVVPRRRWEEGVMENVKSIAVWLLQTRWLTIDGPVFLLLWLGAACYQFHCPCLRTPSFLAILTNWTNTIRAWESPALCLLFPFCCLFHILAYLKPLFSHSGAGNDLYVNFEGTCIHTIQLCASQLNIQVCLHDISSLVCLLEYESAEERHCWFGKPAYGQCKASAFDPPPPRHVLVTLFRFQCQWETLGIPYLWLSLLLL